MVAVILLPILAYLVMSALVGLWTERSLDFVLPLIVHHPVDAGFGLSWLATILLGPIATTFDLVAEIVRHVI